jgi:hypothetical protein
MRPAMLQTASLPLHGMICREGEGQGWRVQWMRRAHWEVPTRVSISGSRRTRLGCDSPSRPAAWLGAGAARARHHETRLLVAGPPGG